MTIRWILLVASAGVALGELNEQKRLRKIFRQ